MNTNSQFSVSYLARCILPWLALLLPVPIEAGQWMMEVHLQGQRIEGHPLAWSGHSVILLGRDGRLYRFAPTEVTDYRRTSDEFRGYSQADIRGQLLREFGRGFDVSGTGHYLVVHPTGQRDQWAPRFESLYRSFVHYFNARGLHPQPLQFPLVAVVFSSREAFTRYAAQSGAKLLPGAVGYYSPTSNRVLLYDVTADSAGHDWHVNAETIIHEAAHQSAFNTGIHSRYSAPPRWVIEGLGTMFEARGVWDAAHNRRQQDRIHRELLSVFRRYVSSGRRSATVADFLSSDRAFFADAEAAYAEAWALTFFLAETQPRQYIDYLKLTANRDDASHYLAPQRLDDFMRVFGRDLRLLDARFLRFVHELP